MSDETQQPAFLLIEALYVKALWLRTDDAAAANEDIFIALKPSFAPLVSGRRYTTAEFLAEVSAMARHYMNSTPSSIGKEK